MAVAGFSNPIVDGDPNRFVAVGTPAASVTQSQDLTIRLDHDGDLAQDDWQLLRQITFASPRQNIGTITIPVNPGTFTTDFASVPACFTWLIPRTGNYVAAAIVHDALIGTGDEGLALHDVGGTYTSFVVDPIDADLVLLDGMKALGTPFFRRWLVWSAVSLRTCWARSLYGKLSLIVFLATIAVLGFFATMDLFDQGSPLFWMADRPWTTELLYGGAMAVAIPLLLCVIMGPHFWRPMAIAGIALAGLIHVTLVVLALTGVYLVVELRTRLLNGQHWWKTLLCALGAAVVVVASILWCRHY